MAATYFFIRKKKLYLNGTIVFSRAIHKKVIYKIKEE